MAEPLPSIIEATETTLIDDGWFITLAQRKRELQRPHGRPSPFVAVFGSALMEGGSRDWRRGYELGAALARGGAVVINGGYGGAMEAAAAGARSVEGTTVGVTCSDLPEKQANPYIVHEWRCERWDQRLIGLVWLADGYVVLPGSSGTLVELAMMIETQLKGFIPIRPAVCLGSFWKPVVQRIIGAGNIVQFASTPVKAAQLAIGLPVARRVRRTRNSSRT